MDARLTRIRELIDQKEAIDTELASLIGDVQQAPKRGRPRKSDNTNGAAGHGSAETPGDEVADA
jgi:hypothetical protein